MIILYIRTSNFFPIVLSLIVIVNYAPSIEHIDFLFRLMSYYLTAHIEKLQYHNLL